MATGEAGSECGVSGVVFGGVMGECRDTQTTPSTLGLNSVRRWRLHGLWLAFLEFRSGVDVSYNDDGLVVTVLP